MMPSPGNPYNPSSINSSSIGPVAPAPSSEEKNWAMLCHLSSLLGFVLVPSANVWAPLVVWLLKKGESAFVDEHGRESLNFHISLWIYGLISSLLWFTIVLIPLVLLFWGVLYLAGVVYSILAAVKAANGEPYRYPFTLRLIS